MTTIIGGSHEKARVAKLKNTIWWAEDGWIHCQHPTEGHTQMRVKDCLLRAQALSEMLGKSAQKDLIKYDDLRKEIQNFLDDVVEVCKQAREQGEYDDPSMARDKKRRKAVSVPVAFQLD